MLTSEDFRVIRALRSPEFGVFVDPDQNNLQGERRIEVVCADGDRVHDYLVHQRKLCGEGGCLHVLALNGGPLAIAKNSPLSNRGGIPHDEVYVRNLQEAVGLKETKMITVTAHFPCGMAGTYNLGVEKVLDLLCEAKDRIRREIRDADIVTMVHVDYHGHPTKHRFSTYFLA